MSNADIVARFSQRLNSSAKAEADKARKEAQAKLREQVRQMIASTSEDAAVKNRLAKAREAKARKRKSNTSKEVK